MSESQPRGVSFFKGELRMSPSFLERYSPERMLEYVALLADSLPVGHKEDFTLLCNTLVEKFESRSAEELMEGSDSGDPDDTIDLGARFYLGLGVPTNVNQANQLWHGIARNTRLPFEQRAMAYSLIATAAQTKAKDASNSDMQSRVIQGLVACTVAEIAVGLGLTSPTILGVATDLVASDPRVREVSPYCDFTKLWGAYNERRAQIELREAAITNSVNRAPNAFQCAACGMKVTEKSLLKRCGGPCPVDVKPSYCTKECQVQDWGAHKPSCKPGEVKSVVVPTTTNTKRTKRPKQREFDVMLPNGVPLRVHADSSKVDAKMMKEIRDQMSGVRARD